MGSICQSHTIANVSILRGIGRKKKNSGYSLYSVGGSAAGIFLWLYEDIWKVSCLTGVIPHYPLPQSMC